MNLEQGFKRVTLVVSAVIALAVPIPVALSLFDKWFWMPSACALAVSIICVIYGLAAGMGAFEVAWLLFFLLRWVGRGLVETPGTDRLSLLIGDSGVNNIQNRFRGIALAAGVLVGLLMCSQISPTLFDRWNTMRGQYEDYVAKKKVIEVWWSVWDRNGFEEAPGRPMSRTEIVKHLLTDGASNTVEIEGKQVSVRASELFPGVNRGILAMTSAQLEKAAQTARADVCFVADPGSLFAKRTRDELALLSIACGLSLGMGGFVGVLLSFLVLKWIVRGFFTTTKQSSREENEDNLQLVPEELPESTGSELCKCDTPEVGAEGAKQPAAVR